MLQDDAKLYNDCFVKAQILIEKGYPVGNMSTESLTNLLIKLETEKKEKDLQSDKNIIFNDEIESIEEVGDMETIDISVTGDNLFYCNGILTKNSFGLPATADLMFALISTEELQSMNQIMVKQLKNRYNDPTMYKRFVIGVDRSKMKLYDVEEGAQDNIIDDTPLFDNSQFGSSDKERSMKAKFKGFS
jgi:hypothetical protein